MLYTFTELVPSPATTRLLFMGWNAQQLTNAVRISATTLYGNDILNKRELKYTLYNRYPLNIVDRFLDSAT